MSSRLGWRAGRLAGEQDALGSALSVHFGMTHTASKVGDPVGPLQGGNS